jgi:hypothetical protein
VSHGLVTVLIRDPYKVSVNTHELGKCFFEPEVKKSFFTTMASSPERRESAREEEEKKTFSEKE